MDTPSDLYWLPAFLMCFSLMGCLLIAIFCAKEKKKWQWMKYLILGAFLLSIAALGTIVSSGFLDREKSGVWMWLASLALCIPITLKKEPDTR